MKKWASFVGVLIILGLLIWILKDIDFYEVYLIIANANPVWFLLAAFFSFYDLYSLGRKMEIFIFKNI